MATNKLHALLVNHYRLGFTRLLLYCDAVVIFIAAYDVIAFRRQGLSLTAALRMTTSIPGTLWACTAIFVCFWLIVLPLSLAFFKIAGVPLVSSFNPSSRPRRILLIHLAVCGFLAFALVPSYHMQLLSGWEENGGRLTTQYQSVLIALVSATIFIRLLASMCSATGLLLSSTMLYVVIGQEPSKAFKQYAVKAALADLPRQFKPKKISLLNPTHLGAAPHTPAAEALASDILRQYYVRSSSVKEQTAIIDGLLAECRLLIRECLMDPRAAVTSPSAFLNSGISFYSGPGRAFEAAIKSAGFLANCIVSPYSTKAVDSVFHTFAALGNVNYVKLTLDAETYYEAWTRQLGALADRISRCSLRHGRTLLVVSEVDYASGMRVPLDAFVEMCKATTGADLFVIADGTNAVGNRCRIRMDQVHDAYVFAPYRWLMAAERCGVVIERARGDSDDHTYGLIQEGSRKRDEEVRTIAMLWAALKVIKERGLDFFWTRCEQLREAFRSGLPHDFQIIGANWEIESTFIMSCCPETSNRWKLNSRELHDRISSICAYASCISVDPERPWMRLSFPYHLDARELNRVNFFLETNAG